jgi:XRE family transcriptional regulator, regulator of sulfur utilization
MGSMQIFSKDRKSPEKAGQPPKTFHFGEGLRDKRLAREISLECLVEKTGIALSELEALESRSGAPPLGTLWKIAGALQIPFAQLLGRRGPPASLVRRSEIEVLRSDDGKMQSRPLVTTALCRWVEVYEITLEGRCQHEAEAHPRGTEEIVVVQRGTLFIRIEQETYELREGDSLAFVADVTHIYENREEQPAAFQDIIAYVR